MAVSDQGQLDLSTFEQLYVFQGSQPFPVPDGMVAAPEIASDPADGSRSVTQLEVTATTGKQNFQVAYDFAAPRDEVWFEFEVRYTHPASASAGSFTLFELFDGSRNTIVALTRLTDSSTEWRALNATTPSTFTFTTGIAKNGWERIRLRYKRSSNLGSVPDGILQAWRWNAGTSSWVLQLDITNHDSTDAAIGFVIQSGPTDDVRAATGSKTVWFRRLTWGLQQSHMGFKHHGLQFGHVCSPGSSSSTIDAKLWYRFPREFHGTQIGGINDPPEVTVQFQYMLPFGTGWTNAGSAVNLMPDGQGEMIATGTATGLSPLTGYWFRAIVTDVSTGGTFTLTTETITCTTPTAAGGEPGQLKYIFGSCADSTNQGALTHPHTVMSRIRDEDPHGFIHLGDKMYADFETYFDFENLDKEVAIRATYRKPFNHDYDHRRLLAGAAFFPMWDDHEIFDNAWGADPDSINSALFAQANAAADAYWVNRRINAIAGGKGWWFDTAKCRMVMMDMRTAKHIGDPSTIPPIPATMLGTTQMSAVKAALQATGKPINFLFSPGPVVRGHGGGTGLEPDGWNQTAMLPLRDEILAHFHNTNDADAILIICSGDRHFTYVATDWGGSEPYDLRIKPEWCSSPLAFRKRDTTTLKNIISFPSTGSTIEYLDNSAGTGDVINRYCRIEIDEQELEVTMTLVNGANGQTLHTATYTASE